MTTRCLLVKTQRGGREEGCVQQGLEFSDAWEPASTSGGQLMVLCLWEWGVVGSGSGEGHWGERGVLCPGGLEVGNEEVDGTGENL